MFANVFFLLLLGSTYFQKNMMLPNWATFHLGKLPNWAINYWWPNQTGMFPNWAIFTRVVAQLGNQLPNWAISYRLLRATVAMRTRQFDVQLGGLFWIRLQHQVAPGDCRYEDQFYVQLGGLFWIRLQPQVAPGDCRHEDQFDVQLGGLRQDVCISGGRGEGPNVRVPCLNYPKNVSVCMLGYLATVAMTRARTSIAQVCLLACRNVPGQGDRPCPAHLIY